MSIYSGPYTVRRLSYVNRDLIEVAKDVAADLAHKSPNRLTSECKVDRHLAIPLLEDLLPESPLVGAVQAGAPLYA